MNEGYEKSLIIQANIFYRNDCRHLETSKTTDQPLQHLITHSTEDVYWKIECYFLARAETLVRHNMSEVNL